MYQPRVLIVQTTPYATNSSSRTLDSYFHYWDRDKVRQIYSRNWIPQKGHCGQLFQIKDSDLLRKWFHRPAENGHIYFYEELEEQGTSQIVGDSELLSKGYKIGRTHTPTIELLRGMLWKEKFWCNEKLLAWLDNYRPEVVFYNFTYNLFLSKIAVFVAERYNIPIITAVADDYYFNDYPVRKILSPANLLFRKKYKELVRILFAHKGCAVFGCNKIRDKYINEFGIEGETIYFSSLVDRRTYIPINNEAPILVYFGNLRLGRSDSLLDIAIALQQINPFAKLKVFSNESDERYFKKLKAHPSIIWGGAVSYEQVKREMAEADIYVVTESFSDKYINFTKYSLSTKAADGLMSGLPVLAYGSIESGVISYLSETKAAMVCTSQKELPDTIKRLMNDQQLQRELYEKSELISCENHTLESSSKKFESVVNIALNA